jgi:hypothetical protein
MHASRRNQCYGGKKNKIARDRSRHIWYKKRIWSFCLVFLFGVSQKCNVAVGSHFYLSFCTLYETHIHIWDVEKSLLYLQPPLNTLMSFMCCFIFTHPHHQKKPPKWVTDRARPVQPSLPIRQLGSNPLSEKNVKKKKM